MAYPKLINILIDSKITICYTVVINPARAKTPTVKYSEPTCSIALAGSLDMSALNLNHGGNKMIAFLFPVILMLSFIVAKEHKYEKAIAKAESSTIVDQNEDHK